MSVATLIEKIPALERADELIGTLLVNCGKLDSHDINSIISYQQENKVRFGEAAVALGLINSGDLLQALSRQFDYPCLPAESPLLSKRLLAIYQPFGEESEKYRALRSHLMLSLFSDERKLLAVVPSEDATTAIDVAANLAIMFAQAGERTLLVDADMRAPAMHELFAVNASPGLSDVLIGRIPLKQAIAKIEAIPTLSLLCAGVVPPNPQELLSRSIFSSFIDIAAKIYDVVILSTPAAAASADAQLVAARAGNCLLSVARHSSSYTTVKRIRETFAATGIHIVGATICDLN